MSEDLSSVMKNANSPQGPSSKYSPILKASSPSGESKKKSKFNQDDSKKNYKKPKNSINPNNPEFLERRNLLSSLLIPLMITEFTKMDLQYSDGKVKEYSPKGIKKSNFGKKQTCGKHSRPLCTFNRTGQCNKGKECKFDHVMCIHEDERLGKKCPRYKSCLFGHKVH